MLYIKSSLAIGRSEVMRVSFKHIEPCQPPQRITSQWKNKGWVLIVLQQTLQLHYFTL